MYQAKSTQCLRGLNLDVWGKNAWLGQGSSNSHIDIKYENKVKDKPSNTDFLFDSVNMAVRP